MLVLVPLRVYTAFSNYKYFLAFRFCLIAEKWGMKSATRTHTHRVIASYTFAYNFTFRSHTMCVCLYVEKGGTKEKKKNSLQ